MGKDRGKTDREREEEKEKGRGGERDGRRESSGKDRAK